MSFSRYNIPPEEDFDTLVRDFERKHYNVMIPIEDFLHQVDEARRSSGLAQRQSAYALHAFCKSHYPDFAELFVNSKLGHGLRRMQGFRDLVFIPSFSPKVKDPKVAHYVMREASIETIGHLIELAHTDDTMTPAQKKNLYRLLDENGQNFDFPEAEEKAVEEDALAKAMLGTFRELAREHPAVTGRIFNEYIGRLGYNDHFKRDDVLARIEEHTKL